MGLIKKQIIAILVVSFFIGCLSKCSSEKDCPHTYSICKNGKCGCKEELVLGKDSLTKKPSCVPAPQHPCQDNTDCHSKAKCIEGKCICQGKRAGNGKNCRDGIPCPIGPTNPCWLNGTCLFSDPLRPSNAICKCRKGILQTKDFNCAECFEDADCGKHGKCGVFGLCYCGLVATKESRGVNKTFSCLPGPPHPCTKKADCNKNGECYHGKCYCGTKGGKEQTGNGKYCWDSLPCPAEFEEKCKAAGDGVKACVVNPKWVDQPKCKCRLGFKTSKAGICLKMTECDKKGLECSTGEVCKKKNDKYECACQDGYERKSIKGTCQDKDECKQDLCSTLANTVCVNVEGSYKCECKEGFKKTDNGGGDCKGICNCGANEICEKGVCKCSSGFVKNSDGECQDLDECSQDKEMCSGTYEECVNKPGNYSCECQTGYEKKNDTCVKSKDECACKRHEKCHHEECKCKKGYIKNEKGDCVTQASVLHATGSAHSSHVVSSHLLSALILGMLGRLAFTA